MSTSLQLINHASIIVKQDKVSLLSDPWYQGDAFHKGWNLIHELTDEEIITVLQQITHIWISHEHPDHFSIQFFKKFGERIRKNRIKILFRETSDKRVETFLIKSGFELIIITLNSWIKLDKDFEILCFKDGFYDSGLAIRTRDKTIINLNDCEIKDADRCNEILKIIGKCDILASQFSYAAWKGGKDNTRWRQQAAKEKLEALKLQASILKPKVLVPFASYFYFSNDFNFYLNDAVNKPEDVVEALKDHDTRIAILSPFSKLNDSNLEIDNKASIDFWAEAYQNIEHRDLNGFDSVDLQKLKELFHNYRNRIFNNNSKWFIKLARYFSPVAVFKPIIIYISDLDETLKLDILKKDLEPCDSNADISMHSESFAFILKNTFGFDTMVVNGCFEELSESGFSRAARTLGVENLNNIGIAFRPTIFLNYDLIFLFLSRLKAVGQNLKLHVT